MAEKDILEFVQSSKNITDTDLDDEKKMNATPASTSSEMRNIMKKALSRSLQSSGRARGRHVLSSSPVPTLQKG
ncbi:hypothetical protein TNCV_849251 [Trichonephila clavipes]|uniref:Uncharacterized protein n=1 Tax=Trichonephila clavipes TaxID=2585209 RepID=A0A8X6RJJ1_TRICX|nr:hypothetical protein TNCV_849251 [Trichonephila clavipes]